MDTFERAKLAHQKKRARWDAWKEKSALKDSEQKASVPVIETKAPEKRAPQVMRVVVEGPVSHLFEVHYGGTLTAGQLAEGELIAAIKRQLSVFGRVV
jgi:hypothetical protein